MSTVHIVSQEFGTKYLTESQSLDFSVFLEGIPEGDTLDLQRVKLSPSVEETIRNNSLKYIFIDSFDNKRDEILKYNRECLVTRATMQVPDILKIKPNINLEEALELVRSIPAGSSIRLDSIQSAQSAKAKATCWLLLLLRPDLNIDVFKSLGFIYEFVREPLMERIQHHPRYLELIDNMTGFRYIDVDSEGYLGSTFEGKLPEFEYIKTHRCLPAELGTQVLGGTKLPDGSYSGEWGLVLQKCFQTLAANLHYNKHSKHIANYVSFMD